MSSIHKSRLPLNKQRASGESWFLQEKHWELGDFTCALPMLEALSLAWGQPVPVFFETPYVGDLFEKCQYIYRYRRRPPFAQPFADTKAPRTLFRGPSNSNYEAHYLAIFGDPLPKDFKANFPRLSDSPLHKTSGKGTIALMHGCYSEELRESKTVPPDKFAQIILICLANHINPVLIGSRADSPYWEKVMKLLSKSAQDSCTDFVGVLDIVGSVQLMQSCSRFCSNDTGLYHVAAASGMTGAVMWVNTPMLPYRAPSQEVFHITDDYVRAFSQWISPSPFFK